MENSSVLDFLNNENIVTQSRKTKFCFWINEEKRELIEHEFSESGLPTKQVFFLKSILESMIIKLDFSDIKGHTMEISKIGNNTQ